MSVISGITRCLKGARRIEIFIGVALLAAAIMLMLNGNGDQSAETAFERRMESALSCIAGAGRVRVLVDENQNGDVEGVLVVAQGADDIRVQLEIRRAVSTLTGADATRIEIVEME